jgi:DNA-binding winged helix-turn-helix (wHTH) protein
MMNEIKHDHERMSAAALLGGVMPSDVIAFGHFRLHAAERFLEKNGVRLKLGSRALDILIALIERAPEVVSKRELLAKVWPDLVVDEGSLRFHIAALRKVLGNGESGSRYVANVAGRGYCFAAPIFCSGAKPTSAESLPAERVATLPYQTHDAAAIGALAVEIANVMIAGLCAKSLVERLLACELHAGDAAVGAGTGLGLSIVPCIVTDLGGAADVESEPGRGTAFTVLLPRIGCDSLRLSFRIRAEGTQMASQSSCHELQIESQRG